MSISGWKIGKRQFSGVTGGNGLDPDWKIN